MNVSDPRTWLEYVPTGYAPTPWGLRHATVPMGGPSSLTVELDPETQTGRFYDAEGNEVTAQDSTKVGENTSDMRDED